MKLTGRVAAQTVLAVMMAVSARAAHWGRPGLWAMTSSMQMALGGMPTIAPEQLARMKKLGIKLPTMGATNTATKVCVTPQDAAADFGTRHYMGERSGCRQQTVVNSGNRFTSTIVCDGQMKGKGAADVTLIDDAHYATVFSFKGVSHGHPVDMKVSTTAHWLGANCGSIKPYRPG